MYEPIKRTPSYLHRPRVEYQYFRRTLWILVKSSLAKLFVFWPFMGHCQIITQLWCISYKLLLPDLSKNSANYSIFASRSSNSPSIHQFYYSASTRLRSQTFSIRLEDESGVGTPLRQNLVKSQQCPKFGFFVWILNVYSFKTSKIWTVRQVTWHTHQLEYRALKSPNFRCIQDLDDNCINKNCTAKT